MSKPKKIKLKSLFIEEDYKNLVYSIKSDENLNKIFEHKAKKYIECIEVESNKSKNELTSDWKDIVQNTLYFLVFIAVHIHLNKKGVCPDNKYLLKKTWDNYMKKNNIQTCKKYDNYLISKKIIFQNWEDAIQFEKNNSTSHKNVTNNCQNDRYIIKYKENTFQFRICLCIINNWKIKILAFDKKKDSKM